MEEELRKVCRALARLYKCHYIDLYNDFMAETNYNVEAALAKAKKELQREESK